MKQEYMKRLQVPEAKYRAKPFWAWNGRLEEKELHYQIDIMKEMGFGGFFMHSRTGLSTEYMGKEWFKFIRSCAIYGYNRGLEAWLYDEDRWPSGTCGGLVTEKRENRMRFISEYASDEAANACPDVERIVARYALRKDAEGKLLDCREVSRRREVPKGWEYAVYAEELMHCTDFYNGAAYLDTMNGDAVEEYLCATHDRYADECGDLLGKELVGIFTDEPHRGEIFNGFGIVNENQFNMMPYTGKAFTAFREKYGREVCIPLIYYGRSGNSLNEEAAAYIDVLDDLFTKNFAEKYRDRCERYGIIFTGHILHEDELGAQTAMSGSMMRFYEYMNYPGIDNLTAHNPCYWAAIQCASVARQMGKPFVLSELYGCTGWDTSLREYKRIGDWQALFGINLRCPHLSWYTMEGEAKRDYPSSILHQNAWYRDWKFIEDYFARIGMILSEGERQADLLVIHPVEQMWKMVRKGWMWSLSAQTEEAKRLNEQFIEQCLALISSCCEFDYGDEELLAKYAEVGQDDKGAYLRVGKVLYRTVMRAEWQMVRESTARLLARFQAAGGKVISSIPQLSSERILAAPKHVATALRRWGGEDWLFLLNLSETEPTEGDVVLCSALCGHYAEEWDMVSFEPRGARSLSGLRFEAGEMRIFRLSREQLPAAAEPEGEQIALPDKMDYELSEPNVLVLDRAKCFVDGQLQFGGEAKEVLRLDRALRERFGLAYRGGEMVQPWFAEKYGKKETKFFGKVRLIYEFYSDIECEAELAAEYENVSCNGIKAEQTSKRWVDCCYHVYRIDVCQGRNEIAMEIEYGASSNIEAVFLLGMFGVSPTALKIVSLPDKLATDEIGAQGFPFYSGAIRYKTGISCGRIKIKLENLHAVSLHAGSGKNEKMIAFPPYLGYTETGDELILTVYFTRRNTFGPFHLRNQPAESYGPFSFVSEGNDWTDDYVRIPQGFACKIYKI